LLSMLPRRLGRPDATAAAQLRAEAR